MSPESRVETLVIGAGPTGLMMAIQLARFGVPVRIVERAEARSDRSRALAIHSRTLELLQTIGVASEVIERGRKIHGVNAWSGGQRLVHVSLDELDAPHPFVVLLPQSVTEEILERRLEQLGVTVARGTELTDLSADGEGTLAVLAAAGGRAESVHARWVIGCDGAHSTTRKWLGVPFEGETRDEPFLLADVRVDPSAGLAGDETHAFLSPGGLLALLPMPGTDRFRLIADAPPDLPAGTEPTLDTVRALFAERGPHGAEVTDPQWIATFRVHRRIAERWRRGSVFLAGDAAHIHSPVGGQGMNTGIQDAVNLAWKLALVRSGAGQPRLLDSYEPERRPIAAATLGGTDLATRVVTVRNPIVQAVRNRLGAFLTSIEVIERRIMERATGIRIGYRGSPIVAEHRAPFHRQTIGAWNGELPGMADWREFGAAPRPGDRVPDLFHLLGGTRFVLFLFDGADPSEEGYANLMRIGARARERHPAWIDVHLIVPRAVRPPALSGWEGSVILDESGAIHRRFGAGSECLYLVRPDGYVGYRSQPADPEPLEAYLEGIFR